MVRIRGVVPVGNGNLEEEKFCKNLRESTRIKIMQKEVLAFCIVALQTVMCTKFPRLYTDRRLGGGCVVLGGLY
jgi:hypothetical protein